MINRYYYKHRYNNTKDFIYTVIIDSIVEGHKPKEVIIVLSNRMFSGSSENNSDVWYVDDNTKEHTYEDLKNEFNIIDGNKIRITSIKCLKRITKYLSINYIHSVNVIGKYGKKFIAGLW